MDGGHDRIFLLQDPDIWPDGDLVLVEHLQATGGEAVQYRSRRLELLAVAISACHGHVEGG